MKKKYVESGISGLDSILNGGFPPQQLYLLQGPSGSGKTTLSLQFLMEGAARGERVLFIGTSETQAEIHSIAASHGWSLEGVHVYHHESHQSQELMDQTVLYPAEVELPQTMESLLRKVEEVQPDRLVIDSLTEIRLMAREEYWYWNQLLLLKNFFKDKKCTVLLTEIPTETEFSVIHSIIHGKIELHQKVPSYGPDRKHLLVSKMQGTDYHTGYHDYRISMSGIIVFPRLIAAEYRHNFKPVTVSTGNADIDKLLGGGLDIGTTILLSGESGAGKSLVATQCAVAAAERGETVAMYIFDERTQTLLQRSAAVGLNLHEHYEKENIHIYQVDPAELTPGEFSHHVKSEVEQGVSMVILDSLNGYVYAMPEERFLNVHLHELSSYLNQMRVTTILVASQVYLLTEFSTSSFEVSYIADTVLHHSYARQEGRQIKTISVYKRRSGDHEPHTCAVRITENGISLATLPPEKSN
ncbi:MAG: ATPase domain-containing protein [Spirochaetota bacterium]